MSPYKKFVSLTFLVTTIIANASAAIAPPDASSNRTSSLDLKISTPRALDPTSLPIAPEKNTPFAVKPTGKILEAETATLSDTISPAKRTDGPINPNIFYSTHLFIQCATVEELGVMDDDPLNYQTFIYPPQRRPRIYTGDDGTVLLHEHSASRRSLRNFWLRKCRDCLCDPASHRVIRKPYYEVPNSQGVYAPPRTACTNIETPPKCENWFNCRCVVEISLQQPPRFREVTAEDYQDALDNIPDHVKNLDPNYVWRPSPGWAMTWNKNEGGGSRGGQAHHRELAPGTKEPYYLEGPDDDDTGMYGLPGRYYPGGELTSPFGKSLPAKRDNLKKRDEDKKEEGKKTDEVRF
ncbi:hypothetical protein TWF106_011099 [Orbilia oligospora]|uniref:Uncharacterized protein n=1 Tax=Orbilia oligospora TaxID=2813651 RepID=A0A6G1M9S1_ORBOL|nr:hypothetical protein TWF106_011099 [Orbilia oligospora]KAF3217950.1 hypothetical protein TWF191_008367 [Orbilia oligospora]KAF3249931.1 hypothetical protein TWF192_005427 [Orbilia oligospora]